MARLPNWVLSVVGTQTLRAAKARLHGDEGRTVLALYERHGAFPPGPREADVGLLGSTTFVLVEVLAEALGVVSVKN